MKTIVVSGASSNVGKTTLARNLCKILPGAEFIKIGHGPEKEDVGNVYYHIGTSFETIKGGNKEAPFLVIESNSVLKEMTPECVIYLPGEKPKRSAAAAREKADIIRGEVVARQTITRLKKELSISQMILLDIIKVSGAFLPPSMGGGVKERE